MYNIDVVQVFIVCTYTCTIHMFVCHVPLLFLLYILLGDTTACKGDIIANRRDV